MTNEVICFKVFPVQYDFLNRNNRGEVVDFMRKAYGVPISLKEGCIVYNEKSLNKLLDIIYNIEDYLLYIYDLRFSYLKCLSVDDLKSIIYQGQLP